MRESVCLAYVHEHEVTHSFHESLNALAFYDAAKYERIAGGGGVIRMRCGTDGLANARNTVVAQFLAGDADYLFWIDTDMGFLPDTVEQLIEVADPETRPIVGGLCFAQKETAVDGYGGYRTSARTTIIDWVETPEGPRFMGRAWYPPATLVRTAATGCACILIHRSVFERIAETHGPDSWYRRALGEDGLALGEDVSFCIRASTCEPSIPVHVHTGVRTTHMKNVWLGEDDFWAQAVAPPATERTAVLVPVLHRPEHAAPFMTSLRASTGLATAYAVIEADDAEALAAWDEQGASILVAPEGVHTFAEKINHAYAETRGDEPWLFLVGSDVVFHAGWLDQAQHAARITGASVVGTNDLGNPRVMRGEHATHMLIRRSYVDEYGASWDGPKVVCHEGYRHWYVDDELCAAARQRPGVWAMALASRVEHMHPIWGKAPDDDVYALGQSHTDDDAKLYKRRLRHHT